MAHNLCPHTPSLLKVLRDWAWERGRTDIVFHLDLHDTAWNFHDEPSRANLVALSAVLPAGKADPGLTEEVVRLAGRGPAGYDLVELQRPLLAWCRQLCGQVEVDLGHLPAQAVSAVSVPRA